MRLLRLLLIASVLLLVFALAVAVLRWPVLVLLIGVVIVARRRKRWVSEAFGSARWASPDERPHSGDGLLVGTAEQSPPTRWQGIKALFTRPSEEACRTFLDAWWRTSREGELRIPFTHCSVFAPTGAGKGVSIIIPHLLSCPDSTVVVDLKGELYEQTAQARRQMGHKVVRLDPFGVCGPGSDTFNPLDWILYEGTP